MNIVTFRKTKDFFSALGTKFIVLINSRLFQSLGILGVLVGVGGLYLQKRVENNAFFEYKTFENGVHFDKEWQEFELTTLKNLIEMYKENYSFQNNVENRNKLAEELNFFTELRIKEGLNKDFLKNYVDTIKKNKDYLNEKNNNDIFIYKNANTFIEKNSQEKNITNSINESDKSIWFYGTSFQITFKDFRKPLLKALCRGVNIRILVPDPAKKQNYELAMLAAGQNSMTEQYKTNETYDYYKNIKAHLSYKKCQSLLHESIKEPMTLGKIELKLFDDIPHYRGYFFDAEVQDKSNLYFVTFHNGVTSRILPGFWIKNTDGLMDLYVEAFNTLWKKASFLPKKPI